MNPVVLLRSRQEKSTRIVFCLQGKLNKMLRSIVTWPDSSVYDTDVKMNQIDSIWYEFQLIYDTEQSHNERRTIDMPLNLRIADEQ